MVLHRLCWESATVRQERQTAEKVRGGRRKGSRGGSESWSLEVWDARERLQLYGVAITDAIVQELTIMPRNKDDNDNDDDSIILCPSLSFIYLKSDHNAGGVRVETVEEMVISRWKTPNRKLREVRFDIPGLRKLGLESERARACMRGRGTCGTYLLEREVRVIYFRFDLF